MPTKLKFTKDEVQYILVDLNEVSPYNGAKKFDLALASNQQESLAEVFADTIQQACTEAKAYL